MNFKQIIAAVLFLLERPSDAFSNKENQLPSDISQDLKHLSKAQKQQLFDSVSQQHPEFKTQDQLYNVLYSAMDNSNETMIFSMSNKPTCLQSSNSDNGSEIEVTEEFSDYIATDPNYPADISTLFCGGVVDLRKIPGFPADICEVIQRKYESISSQEQQVLMDVLGFLETPEQVLHFFAGAHIELIDSKQFYTDWTTTFSAAKSDDSKGVFKSRFSSHQSDSYQYAVSGEFLSEALFGTRMDENKQGITWIQLENSPVAPLGKWIESPSSFFIELHSLAVHMLDFLDYRINGKNIGPYGKSQYTEAAPLRIDVSKFSEEKRLENSLLWEAVFLRNPGVLTPNLYKRIHDIQTNQKSLGL